MLSLCPCRWSYFPQRCIRTTRRVALLCFHAAEEWAAGSGQRAAQCLVTTSRHRRHEATARHRHCFCLFCFLCLEQVLAFVVPYAIQFFVVRPTPRVPSTRAACFEGTCDRSFLNGSYHHAGFALMVFEPSIQTLDLASTKDSTYLDIMELVRVLACSRTPSRLFVPRVKLAHLRQLGGGVEGRRATRARRACPCRRMCSSQPCWDGASTSIPWWCCSRSCSGMCAPSSPSPSRTHEGY